MRRSHWPKRGTTQADVGIRLGFRSGLEARNAKHLEAHGEPVLFETFKVKYALPLSWHTYTVDFRLRNGVLIETKGRWLPADRAKHLFVKAQYPDLDIRIVFDRSKALIAPTSSTTLAEWADKHGFRWAEKLIPAEWMAEAGPRVTPEEALTLGPIGYREILATERKRR